MATQSFGAGLKTHPHFHLLVTDGVFFPGEHEDFYRLGFWDVEALTDKVRQSVTKSLVARGYLHEETAEVLLSWPLERSGFSVFVGEPLSLPQDKPDVGRVLRYILRSSLPLNRLHYDEASGSVRYQDNRGPWKSWGHAIDFLADFVQHIPRARQHKVTYAGYFANALGHLSPAVDQTQAPSKKPSQYTRWAALVLRCWATDPEQCPRCGQTMRRSRALFERQQLLRLLKNLGLGDYPSRPRSPPPPELETTQDQSTPGSPEDQSQVPPDWEDWDAA